MADEHIRSDEFRAGMTSVIIPTYKRRDDLLRSVRSALAQTVSDIEVIVVDDDPAPNEVADLLDAIGNPHIRYLKHERNLGGAGARNTGIDAACGEFTAFLDSDDTFHPDKVERCLEALNRAADRVIVYSQIEVLLPNRTVLRPGRPIGRAEHVADYMFVERQPMQASSLFMRTADARAVRFTVPMKKHQDYDFVLRAEAMGLSFTMVERPLVSWHLEDRRGHMSFANSYAFSREWCEAYRKYMSDRAYAEFYATYVFRLAHVEKAEQLRMAPGFFRRHFRLLGWKTKLKSLLSLLGIVWLAR